MYIGIDLGGTNIAVGLVSEDGKIIIQDSCPTESGRPTGEIVADMARLSKELIDKQGLTECDIKAVGIGCPGTIKFETGEVVYSNNIKMEHYPLAEEFKKHLDLPVYVDNDANCATMGEYMSLEEKVDCFMLVTLGTGVGSGLILDGAVYRGFNGAAPEAGHMTLVSGGIECTCGKAGCFECYASVTALIRQTKEAMDNHPDSLMHKIAEEQGKVNGRVAFDAAKQGDSAAIKVVENYTKYIADGIVSIENFMQPEVIAIGGGISKEGDYLLNPVIEYINNNRFNKFMQKTKIVTAKLFNDAGIIGAAGVAMKA